MNFRICSLGEEQCSYANLSSSNVLPLERNRDDESHIEQIFISVPKINQHVNLSSPIERTNQKRRSSNLGIFYSPRNSVEIERQFQVNYTFISYKDKDKYKGKRFGYENQNEIKSLLHKSRKQ